MARFSFRRSLRFESLESRRLMSTAGPTAEEQYMLQILNQARMNPSAATQELTNNLTPDVVSTLQYYNVDLQQSQQQISSASAQPPLAWNASLASAAQGQSQYMADTQIQSHTGANGSTPQQRIAASGYGNALSTGENAYAYSTSAREAMQAFLIDWGVPSHGHRNNIQQPGVSQQNAYRDVGIGIVQTGNTTFGPEVVTQDFASLPNEQAQIVGVAYNDNGSHFYSIGSGVGGVQISAVNLNTGQVASTQTWASGGYELPLAPGDYQVIASQNGQVVSSNQINVGTVNIENDVVMNNSWVGGSLSAAIAALQPAPAPVVTAPVVVIPVQAPAPVVTVSTPVATPLAVNWQIPDATVANSSNPDWQIAAPATPSPSAPNNTTTFASVDSALSSWSTWNAQVD